LVCLVLPLQVGDLYIVLSKIYLPGFFHLPFPNSLGFFYCLERVCLYCIRPSDNHWLMLLSTFFLLVDPLLPRYPKCI